MQIIYRTGNLLKSEQNMVIHGCNASGVAYNAGIAAQVRKLHPEAYISYRDASDTDRRLGNVIWTINASKALIIGNAITQQDYGSDGKRYVDYDAVRTVMLRVDEFVQNWRLRDCHVPGIDLTTVGFPLIGTGHGGGKWSVISKLIEENSHSFQPVVYILNGIIPA